MNRADFLANNWLPFPAIESKTVDSAAALAMRFASEPVSVGGRLVLENGNAALDSGGARLSIKFTDTTVWKKSALKVNASFSQALLISGDLLCLRGNTKSENGVTIFVAEEVVLLVPTDTTASAGVTSFSVEKAKLWQKYVQTVREFFEKREFVEMRTPTLVPSPGTEPFLDAMSTQVQFGSRETKVFLPTSPEFHLKKILVAGHTKIFEFKDCFRNKEAGEHHQPEFLMLEWYRAYANLEQIAEDVELLLKDVSKALRGETCSLKRTTIAKLFSDHLNFELTPETSKKDLLDLAKQQSIECGEDESWDDIYFRIFLTKIEPALVEGGPYLVGNYPPSQAALARLTSDGWADRFEIYWGGLEIANAFHELNDPAANMARFTKDAEDARSLGKQPVPHDEELIQALKIGMPPSGGIALGMDRLFMAALKIASIEETRAFPFRD